MADENREKAGATIKLSRCSIVAFRGSLVSSDATLATRLYLMFATRSHRDWSPERNREVDR